MILVFDASEAILDGVQWFGMKAGEWKRGGLQQCSAPLWAGGWTRQQQIG